MSDLRVKTGIACLLGASLLVFYGCAEQRPDPEAPSAMPPAEQEYDETESEVPPPAPPGPGDMGPGDMGPGMESEEAPPPATGEQPPPADPFPPGDSPGGPDGAEGGAVSQAEIDEFAQIQAALVPLQQELAQEARAGASQAQLQQLQNQLQQRADQIIQASSLSPKRFGEIATLVERDPDLLRRVRAAFEQKTGGS